MRDSLKSHLVALSRLLHNCPSLMATALNQPIRRAMPKTIEAEEGAPIDPCSSLVKGVAKELDDLPTDPGQAPGPRSDAKLDAMVKAKPQTERDAMPNPSTFSA